MSWQYPLCNQIRLHVEGRIALEDAHRQERTAREILRRLERQPGLILADEVGMGKTFVALAAAISVNLADPEKRPVVVMVPPSLRDKWPGDFRVFVEKCLPEALGSQLRCGRAERAVEFLKLLDDPPERRKSIIFVTHGAMSAGLNDKWVVLALIARTLRGRWGTDEIRQALCQWLGTLLQMNWVERGGKQVWQHLLTNSPEVWLKILHRYGIDPEGDDDEQRMMTRYPRPSLTCCLMWIPLGFMKC